MLAGALEWADLTDLDGLREAFRLADPEGRLAPMGMSRVEIGRRALDLLPEVVSELAMDPTPMRRGDHDLKAGVERLLAERFDFDRARSGGGGS